MSYLCSQAGVQLFSEYSSWKAREGCKVPLHLSMEDSVGIRVCWLLCTPSARDEDHIVSKWLWLLFDAPLLQGQSFLSTCPVTTNDSASACSCSCPPAIQRVAKMPYKTCYMGAFPLTPGDNILVCPFPMSHRNELNCSMSDWVSWRAQLYLSTCTSRCRYELELLC